MHTWEEARAKWLREGFWRAPETKRREAALLAWAEPHLAGRRVASITRADLEQLRDRKRAEGSSPRTANYVAQVVGAILRRCVRWEWMDRAPSIERLHEGPAREVFLTPRQAAQLLAALPEHLQLLAEFSLETGLRQGNARLLEWRHVDMERNRLYLPGEAVKNRKALLVPLTPRARAILRQCRGDHPRFVFTYDGAPMLQPRNSAWYRALRRLGMVGVRWHDLRHTWASWHMAAGTDPLVLQKLGGWKTWAMVSRYTHLDDRTAQRAVRRFAGVARRGAA
ncbi:MAG TPA: site-specific integrase [Reyranellaceae bacterium]|nr:site-specific integrase [Reyranellaceae bacterium]